MVRSIGADAVLDYTKEDFTQAGRRYDVMLDLVGSRSISDCRRALTSRGTYVVVGVEKADSPDALYTAAGFVTLHLPNTPETRGWLDAEALSKCKDGVRVLNVARGPLVVDADLQAALDSGKVGGVALDVFSTEPSPITRCSATRT